MRNSHSLTYCSSDPIDNTSKELRSGICKHRVIIAVVSIIVWLVQPLTPLNIATHHSYHKTPVNLSWRSRWGRCNIPCPCWTVILTSWLHSRPWARWIALSDTRLPSPLQQQQQHRVHFRSEWSFMRRPPATFQVFVAEGGTCVVVEESIIMSEYTYGGDTLVHDSWYPKQVFLLNQQLPQRLSEHLRIQRDLP